MSLTEEEQRLMERATDRLIPLHESLVERDILAVWDPLDGGDGWGFYALPTRPLLAGLTARQARILRFALERLLRSTGEGSSGLVPEPTREEVADLFGTLDASVRELWEGTG